MRSDLMRALGPALVVGLLTALVSAPAARATHQLPNPPFFWDTNNDSVADPNAATIDADGAGWTQPKLDRLTEATDDWDNSTQWNPSRVVTGANNVYIDGTVDTCGINKDLQYAVTCVHYTNRETSTGQLFKDISLVNTTFNNELTRISSAFFWWYGSAHSSDTNSVDFGGISSHEIGHWVFLNDLSGAACNYGPSMYTMCGIYPIATADDDTWRTRNVTTDDINAVNIVY